MAQDACLVVVSAIFFYAHSRLVLDGHFTSLFFAIEQGLLVGMFLFRRRSHETSMRPLDWIVATIGGWLPLALIPSGDQSGTAQVLGMGLQLAGLSCTIVGFLYLGKSFGIVAADRGLKVGGPYRLLRHPIYASHVITLSGFLIANATTLNIALYIVVMAAQVLRIHAEERLLARTSQYNAYRQQVRWRLIPGLF
jgi:protein-S-isoprenylcysteine O-methyltransferase Ste14